MTTKKLVSLLLSVLLLLAAAVPAVSVHAADSVTVTLVYSDGNSIRTFYDMTVTDGTAEAYGLTPDESDHTGKRIETVTALDALVQAHAELYGTSFTAETAGNYLTVSYGFASKAFGQSDSFSFTVNDVMPHDNTLIHYNFGDYYTGYALDTTCLQTGDVIVLYNYHDANWMDFYPLFTEKEYTVTAGKPLQVRVNGYSIMPYGCCEQSLIDANTVPMADAQLYLTKDLNTAMTPAGTLDADGSAFVTVNEPGTWYLLIKGSVNNIPVIPLIRKITVTEYANPTAKTQLKVPLSLTVGYKSNVYVTVLADKLPEGYEVALYEGDTLLLTGADGVCWYFEKMKESKALTAKIIDADGNVQSNTDGVLEKTFEINVKTGFFAKLKAFILGLFGIYPTFEIEP